MHHASYISLFIKKSHFRASESAASCGTQSTVRCLAAGMEVFHWRGTETLLNHKTKTDISRNEKNAADYD